LLPLFFFKHLSQLNICYFCTVSLIFSFAHEIVACIFIAFQEIKLDMVWKVMKNCIKFSSLACVILLIHNKTKHESFILSLEIYFSFFLIFFIQSFHPSKLRISTNTANIRTIWLYQLSWKCKLATITS